MVIEKSWPPEEMTVGTGISPALDVYDMVNYDRYAILYPLTEKPAAHLVAKHEGITGNFGDGLKALGELFHKNNKVTQEVIRATMEEIVKTSMK